MKPDYDEDAYEGRLGVVANMRCDEPTARILPVVELRAPWYRRLWRWLRRKVRG